jgi:tryptophan-rich sensory protein
MIFAAAAVLAILGVGGATTKVDAWYKNLRKPTWNPPGWAFAPAWTIILGLAGWAGVDAWAHAETTVDRWRIGVLFGVNAVCHLLWSPLFFTWKRPDWALAEVPFLWFSVLALIVGLAPLSTLSAWLLAPYLVWVAFAAFLNLTIVRLNAPFGARVVAQPR